MADETEDGAKPATSDAESGLHVIYSRIPEPLYEKLVKVAKRDGHSVSKYVERVLTHALARKRV